MTRPKKRKISVVETPLEAAGDASDPDESCSELSPSPDPPHSPSPEAERERAADPELIPQEMEKLQESDGSRRAQTQEGRKEVEADQEDVRRLR